MMLHLLTHISCSQWLLEEAARVCPALIERLVLWKLMHNQLSDKDECCHWNSILMISGQPAWAES
jgi:hypothetical protein